MKKDKGFSMLAVIVVVVVVAVIALGVYFVLKESKTNPPAGGQQNNQYQAPQPQDPLAGWKTFTNNDFGFEIKYPADWQVSVSGASKNMIVFSTPFSQTQFYNMNIDVEINKQNLSAKSWVDKILADNSKQEIGKITYKSSQESQVAGTPAYELGGVFAYDQNQEWIFVPGNGYMFKFSFPTAEENPNLVDPINNNKKARDMLSTFKLTQPQASQPVQGK